MTEQAANPPSPVNPACTPEARVPACIRCDYSLEGLQVSGKCPECGLSIPHMRGHEPLDTLPPALLRRMHSGLTIILAALACKVLLHLLPSLFGSEPLSRARRAVMKFSGARISPGDPIVGDLLTASLLYSVALLLVGAFSLFGYIRFTTPENAPYIIGLRDLNRRVSRVAAFVEFSSAAVIASALFVPGLAGIHPLAYFVLFVALATWSVAHFAHVSRLARRAGHESLATLSMRTRWVVPLSLVLSMGLFMAGVALGGGWVSALMVVAFPSLLLPIGLHVVVLWRTRSLLSRAIAAKADGGGMVARPAEVEGQGA